MHTPSKKDEWRDTLERDSNRPPVVSPNVPPTEMLLSRDDLFPASIATAHGLPSSFAITEAPSSGALYKALLLYAAQYAVDLDEDLPSFLQQAPLPLKKSNKATKVPHTLSHASHIAPEVKQFLEDAPGKTLMTRRAGEGRLCTLWNCPEDDLESFDSSSSSSDSENDEPHDVPDFVDGDAEDPDGKDTQDGGTNGPTAHTHGLRSKRPPRVQRWQFGLGYAKLVFRASDEENDEVILLRHVAFTPPLASYDDFGVFRTLALAGSDTRVLRALCAYATKWKVERAEAGARTRPGTFTLFRYKLYGSSGAWEKQRRKRGRPKQSVILKDRMLDAIVSDVRDFCARDTKAWYESHGIPHRRSLLFYGPPGTGKTSTIKMLAGMFRLNACFLSFTSPDFSNQSLHDALSSLPGRALLVLEDVDVLFNEDRKAETSSSVTFSGLLNAIDGLISVDGIITIFTTNHIDRLDKALIRGGRVDRRFEFVHPNAAHIAQVFKSFYPDASQKLAREFANRILERKEDEARTIATMQQHFIYTRRLSAEECVEKVPEFFKEFYADGAKSRSSIYI